MQEKKQSSRLDYRPPTSPQVSAKVDCRRPSGPMPLIRPRTVQAKPTEKKPNYRDLKTPFMARQAYSGLIKHNQSSFKKKIEIKKSSGSWDHPENQSSVDGVLAHRRQIVRQDSGKSNEECG